MFARIPDHPGAQHYKIHAYAFPLLADRALEVCDSYGSTGCAARTAHANPHLHATRVMGEID